MSDERRHPDLAELEALRTGEASPETESHVRDCPECRGALEELCALGARIQAAAAPPPARVRPETDRAVLAGIADQAARIRISRRRWMTWAAAAAAVLVLAVGTWTFVDRTKPGHAAQAAAEIRTGAGADIVDAYLMDRWLRSGRTAPAEWDLNRDGRVDRRDVEALKHKVVAVSQEGT